jgi:hypothetical protein
LQMGSDAMCVSSESTANSKSEITILPIRNFDVTNFTSDCSKANRLLGYEPKSSLEGICEKDLRGKSMLIRPKSYSQTRIRISNVIVRKRDKETRRAVNTKNLHNRRFQASSSIITKRLMTSRICDSCSFGRMQNSKAFRTNLAIAMKEQTRLTG